MTTRSFLRSVAGALAVSAALVGAARAEDWPTYQHDAQRSGVTAETLQAPLAQQWVMAPAFPPRNAWSDPHSVPVEGVLELPRVRFDDAFHPVAAGGRLFFGSSADNTVYALDAASGKPCWSFVTDAPVRLAPTVWQDKVYVGSDDGVVYCLNAADGTVKWRFAAAPAPRMLLGNGGLISLWPVRSGVLVEDGVAYFAAGVFPAEGLVLYAVKAEDGTLVWKNDTYGQAGKSQLTPQGYLLASKERLFMPSGRTTPAGFSRTDGRYLFQPNVNRWNLGIFGGTWAVLAGDVVINGTEQLVATAENNGQAVFSEEARRLVVGKDSVYLATGKDIVGLEREPWVAINRKRLGPKQRILMTTNALAEPKGKLNRLVQKKQPVPPELASQVEQLEKTLAQAKTEDDACAVQLKGVTKWTVPCEFADALVLTPTLLFAGGQDAVVAFDTTAGKEVWKAKVDGKARGMAVADGRLYVATDTGHVHCFAPGEADKDVTIKLPVDMGAAPAPAVSAEVAALAAEIAKDADVTRGYGLVLGSVTPGLAAALATSTELMLYVVEPDAAKAGELRLALTAAGLHGGRVVVRQDVPASVPYPEYFANLIVVDAAPGQVPPAQVLRMLKPCGGTACLLAAQNQAERGAWVTGLEAAVVQAQETKTTEVTPAERWVRLRRGPLPGAGNWTHEYAEPGNTACGDDVHLRAPLSILWFGDPGPGRMPSRHASGAAPLVVGPRVFIEAENVILAYDIYNGVPLWEREIPGSLRLNLKMLASNWVANADSIFLLAQGKCLQLDPRTGATIRTFEGPPGGDGKPRSWDLYLACAGNTLFGGAGRDLLFAIDIASGQVRWQVPAKNILPTGICVNDGKLFAVDFELTDAQKEECLKGVDPASRVDKKGAAVAPDVRRILAIDAQTGQVVWQRAEYVSDCVGVGSAGGEMTAMATRGTLVLCAQPWNGHFWPEFFAGEFSRRSLIVLDDKDGRLLWSARKGYRSRPLIVGDTIYAEPWAYDLRTGTDRTRVNPLTGAESPWQMSRTGHHCGNIDASPNLLMFRSGSFAYYDLLNDYGTVHFGSVRPSCWINYVAAGGLLIMPEGGSGCVCPYSLQCTTVFSNRPTAPQWGQSSLLGDTLPVRRLALHFGAPGDWRDANGGLWLAFPRPARERLVFDFKLDQAWMAGGGNFTRYTEPAGQPAAAKSQLLMAGARGVRRVSIPLVGEPDGTALYTVRLTFSADPNDTPGSRVFSLKLQDQPVADKIDVAAEAGTGKSLTREFTGIKADSAVTLELGTPATTPKPEQMPLLHGVEMVREKVLNVGAALMPYVVSDGMPKMEHTLRVRNHTDKAFEGQMTLTAPAMFAVTPATLPVRLAPEERLDKSIAVAVQAKGKVDNYELQYVLTDAAGREEFRGRAAIEYLGPRGRVVVFASADACVKKAEPGRNLGTGPTLAIDGGNAKMGDENHTVAFLKFPLQLPGKPVKASLRLFVPAIGGAESGDSAYVKLAEGAWEEKTITAANAPPLGREIGRIKQVENNTWIECPLDVDLAGMTEITIALDPASTDGTSYVSREGEQKPELRVEYEEPAAAEK
ncbi:MAG: hypothetical protein A3K19_12560 [Lentisphaerae bacterium RIFOXYB12_FULL_65_16]|nr:MAG: hypothetical protein A3K18_12115 [Lentisphaerae bacterium RIFOXYA12_64_32]OGV88115.1 MAG: hypothetical protein A3K19_12560 [Lentisphaerae bacterium RIFOXYB12_FULL_65_16]